MERLILLLISLVIAIIVLPFVALAKAKNAKRAVDDLVTRLSSLENQMRSLQGQTVAPMQSQVSTPAPEVVPPSLSIIAPAPVVPEATSEPPPIPRELLEP